MIHELKCSTPRCVELPTMCWTFSDVWHILVDVSTFTSCVTLPHLGSVPLFVYPLYTTQGQRVSAPSTVRKFQSDQRKFADWPTSTGRRGYQIVWSCCTTRSQLFRSHSFFISALSCNLLTTKKIGPPRPLYKSKNIYGLKQLQKKFTGLPLCTTDIQLPTWKHCGLDCLPPSFPSLCICVAADVMWVSEGAVDETVFHFGTYRKKPLARW